jgi:hypothetical protein
MSHIMRSKPGVVCQGRGIQDPVTMRVACNLCREEFPRGNTEPVRDPRFEGTPEGVNQLIRQKAAQRAVDAERERLKKDGKIEEAEALEDVALTPSQKSGLSEGVVASPAGVAAMMKGKKPPPTPTFVAQAQAAPLTPNLEAPAPVPTLMPPVPTMNPAAAAPKIAEAQENAPMAPLQGMLDKAANAGEAAKSTTISSPAPTGRKR